MTTTVPTSEPTPTSAPAPAARVVDAVKLYGAGDTRVRALDGVSVDFPSGRFTAIMGPSGSGKSTLMHCAAGLDTLTSGSAFIGDTDISTLDDRRLTLLRRSRIGFVFQSFNLLPTLTVAENITLPLDLAGSGPTPSGSTPSSTPSGSGTGCTTGPANCPAASSSGWRWRGPSRAAPTSSSPTNRPATSTPDPARKCSGCSAAPSGRPPVRS